MKIIKWLSPRNSNINGHALIKVEPGETAEIEEMLKLVDGDSVGHFGVKTMLIATEKMPNIKPAKYRGKPMGSGYFTAEQQFGFNRASTLKKQTRYYGVFVRRD